MGDIRTRFNISSTVLGVLLLGSLTTCQPTQQPRLDAGRTEIRFSNYRVLFDRNQGRAIPPVAAPCCTSVAS